MKQLKSVFFEEALPDYVKPQDPSLEEMVHCLSAFRRSQLLVYTSYESEHSAQVPSVPSPEPVSPEPVKPKTSRLTTYWYILRLILWT